MPKGIKFFCPKPFTWFDVTPRDVFLCCPVFNTPPIGNIQTQAFEEIWNGEQAREIRRSVLSGSFEFCNPECDFLQTGPALSEMVAQSRDKELRMIIRNGLTVLPFGPRVVNCSFDGSCNLSCPSCRKEAAVEIAGEALMQSIQDKLEKAAMKDARLLIIAGYGDPFGSPYYRRWLQGMNVENMPALEGIHLRTNGQLWTPRVWSTIPREIREKVRSAHISIDAATPETYAVNRRGGSFDRLLENLYFIGTLRSRGPLKSVMVSMVVQKNNFAEMPAFISLGERYSFDRVYFSPLENRGTYSDEEFRSRAIHLPGHPNHGELLDLLGNKIFYKPVVDMGDLSSLLPFRKNPRIRRLAGRLSRSIYRTLFCR